MMANSRQTTICPQGALIDAVYAMRLGASVATLEPTLHRVTTIESRGNPLVVDAIPH